MHAKVLLADDHSIIRKGLKLLCEMNLGLTEVQTVTNCSELMKELGKKKYTHLVLDINLSDGSSLEVLPNIRSLYPDLQISILSMQPAGIYTRALKQYAITFFISKAAPEDDTLEQLRQFFQNEQPHRDNMAVEQLNSPFSDFTPRELEILHYMLKGIGTNEIAKSLNLKWNTISTFKNRIFEKTMTTNVIELKELASLCKVN